MLNRRLLMAQGGETPPGGGVVTDGLVLWLDGADRGGTPGIWLDKVKGRQFNIVNGEELEIGVRMGYGHDAIVAETPEVFSPIGATIEFCRSNHDTSRGVALFQNHSGDPSFTVENFRGNLILTNVAHPWPQYPFPSRMTPYTASFCEKYGFVNKEKLLPLAKNFWRSSGDGIFTIGSPQFHDTEVIYSLRIYNRQLTEAEILQNQQYDIDTYFGGVTP